MSCYFCVSSITDLSTSSLGLTVSDLQFYSVDRSTSKTVSPSSSTSNDSTLLSYRSEFTPADDDYISPFERRYFYNGISEDPPPLFQRSDLKERPYPIPEERAKERFSAIPRKTIRSADHPMFKNALWTQTVCPEITALLKEESRGIHVSMMMPVRFSTRGEDGKDVYDDHIVLWIFVHPNTTKETACRDANAPILAIFAKHDIHDVAVHWIEGATERLVG